MRMRWGAYAGVSTALAGGVIVKALAQRPNFYSAAVYLAQSNANLMILTNFIFVTSCTFLLSLQKLLYGPLRPIEIEQLYEKAWFAVTETCLAMTVFRGEIGAWFLVMFFALLTGKVWGWIGEGRVEVLEQQPPANPRLFHSRMAASLLVSVLYDTWMLEYVVKQVLDMARPDMMVMFGFEFAVLSVLSLSTLARYVISLVEILIVRGQKYRRAEEIRKERREAIEAEQRTATESVDGTQQTTSPAQPSTTDVQATPTTSTALVIPDDPIDESELEVEGWEDKGRWIFYLDLLTDFLKLVIYLSFFFILLMFYGLPIHIMRDVFLTCRSFFKRIGDFLRYRTATRDMNERYPDATAEEIGREDVCIICREEMRVIPRTDGQAPANATDAAAAAAAQPARQTNPVAERMRPKKLPCGHVLHFSCLRSWLERQQICPTCRQPVLPRGQNGVGAAAGGAAAAGGFGQGFADGLNDARRQIGQNQPPHQQGNGQGQANGNGQLADGQNQNRPRVFQIGPLRIVFGAGRGMMFDDLAQRVLHDGEPAPGPNGQGAVGQNGPNQYGFGFGFGRPNRRTTPRTTSVQGQLDHVERQIQREIDGLRLAANELGVVRLLQGELARLRGVRSQPGASTTATAGQRATPASQLNPASQSTTTTATGFVADTRQTVLEAGNEALPPGLTLPEGWRMMPLQRMQPGTQIPPMGTAFPQPAAFGLGGAQAQFPMQPGQIPDLVQMVQGMGGLGQMPMQTQHQHPQPGQQTPQTNGGHHHHHHHHHHRPEATGDTATVAPTTTNGNESASTAGSLPTITADGSLAWVRNSSRNRQQFMAGGGGNPTLERARQQMAARTMTAAERSAEARLQAEERERAQGQTLEEQVNCANAHAEVDAQAERPAPAPTPTPANAPTWHFGRSPAPPPESALAMAPSEANGETTQASSSAAEATAESTAHLGGSSVEAETNGEKEKETEGAPGAVGPERAGKAKARPATVEDAIDDAGAGAEGKGWEGY